MIAIALVIRRQRLALKLTQQELASKLQVSARSVSNWENQREMPRSHMIPRLVEELCISDDEAQRLFFERSKKIVAETDPHELDTIMEQMRAEAERDASLLSVLRDLLAGRQRRREADQSDQGQ